MTLPTLCYMEERPHDADVRALLNGRMGDAAITARVVEAVRASNAIRAALAEARQFVARGLSALDSLPPANRSSRCGVWPNTWSVAICEGAFQLSGAHRLTPGLRPPLRVSRREFCHEYYKPSSLRTSSIETRGLPLSFSRRSAINLTRFLFLAVRLTSSAKSSLFPTSKPSHSPRGANIYRAPSADSKTTLCRRAFFRRPFSIFDREETATGFIIPFFHHEYTTHSRPCTQWLLSPQS